MKSIFLLDLKSDWSFQSGLFISDRELNFTIRCEDKDGLEVDLTNRISTPWLNDILYDENGKLVFKFSYDFCKENIVCDLKKAKNPLEKHVVLSFSGGLSGISISDIVAKVLGYSRVEEIAKRRINHQRIQIDIQPTSNDNYYIHSITVDASHLLKKETNDEKNID